MHMIYCSHHHLFALISQYIYIYINFTPHPPPSTVSVDCKKGDRVQSLMNKDCSLLIGVDFRSPHGPRGAILACYKTDMLLGTIHYLSEWGWVKKGGDLKFLALQKGVPELFLCYGESLEILKRQCLK